MHIKNLTTYKVYPFAAIIGQEKMKLSLLLNAVNPAIGGVLIRGEKGTAKSTAVRGLARLMPQINVIDECPCRCNPQEIQYCNICEKEVCNQKVIKISSTKTQLIDLPLGATEDMVLGSIDFEAAVKTGKSCFYPGVLARANRGILYIDEINLLDDHLVDSILGAAESGFNIVEREGMSVWHPSRFILIGTMNPEEGELRPQILDRFGLSVQVEAETDLSLRIELLKRREQFDLDPSKFVKQFHFDSIKISEKIVNARSLLSSVFIPNHLRTFITEICLQNNVAGHRADLAIERAACAHAALNGRIEVLSDDIIAVAPLALLHRIRNPQEPSMPPPPPSSLDNNDHNEQESSSEENEPSQQPPEEAVQPNNNNQHSPTNNNDSCEPETNNQEQQVPDNINDSSSKEDIQEIGAPFKVRKFSFDKDRLLRSGSGRRSRTRSATRQGRYVKSTTDRTRNDLALDATLRAAAPFQIFRRKSQQNKQIAIHIKEIDIREKIRERRIGNALLFVVDGSGSMGAQRRMVETKAAIMSLLLDAYQKRDKVCMIVFRGKSAEVILPPTGSVDLAGKLLSELPVGGQTPLSAGLTKTTEILDQIFRKTPNAKPLVILITDGKANIGLGDTPPHKEAIEIAANMRERFDNTRFIVIDTEPQGVVRFDLACELTSALGAEYFHPENLCAEELVKIARNVK